MDLPLQAHTFNEGRYYLMVRPCPACESGPMQIESKQVSPGDDGWITARTRCDHCGGSESFTFRCDTEPEQTDQTAEVINPTDSPSRIVDLAGWLSLFYMLAEAAAANDDKFATRRDGYRAALCLAEALKFYDDNELPGEAAFFSDETRSVFREHPEEYARQKLRDMQARLPALSRMAKTVRKDTHTAKPKWWQLWK